MKVEWKGKEIDLPLPEEEGIIRNGYHYVVRAKHPNARPSDGYIAVHRYVMSQIYGRPLRPDEVVHHKDHNRLNNHPKNLALIRGIAHKEMHGREQGGLPVDNFGRPRRRKTGG